jgi:hypothetical protein
MCSWNDDIHFGHALQTQCHIHSPLTELMYNVMYKLVAFIMSVLTDTLHLSCNFYDASLEIKISASASFSGGPGYESWPGDWLSWPRFLVFSFSSSNQMRDIALEWVTADSTTSLPIHCSYVGFLVFTAVVMKSTIFWDITLCSPLNEWMNEWIRGRP